MLGSKDRSTVGKITTGQVDYLPALIAVIASIIASQLGANAGKKVNTKVMQVILAILIVATGRFGLIFYIRPEKPLMSIGINGFLMKSPLFNGIKFHSWTKKFE
jgi:quinol-cytochrome oxidoreductase complex cytochrome b subunit